MARLWIRASVHDRGRNTLATQTGEDKDFIHMGEGNTGENNQGSGVTSDQGHKRKGKWPEIRGELLFKIKHEIHKPKPQDRTSLTAMWHRPGNSSARKALRHWAKTGTQATRQQGTWNKQKTTTHTHTRKRTRQYSLAKHMVAKNSQAKMVSSTDKTKLSGRGEGWRPGVYIVMSEWLQVCLVSQGEEQGGRERHTKHRTLTYHSVTFAYFKVC